MKSWEEENQRGEKACCHKRDMALELSERESDRDLHSIIESLKTYLVEYKSNDFISIILVT